MVPFIKGKNILILKADLFIQNYLKLKPISGKNMPLIRHVLTTWCRWTQKSPPSQCSSVLHGQFYKFQKPFGVKHLNLYLSHKSDVLLHAFWSSTHTINQFTYTISYLPSYHPPTHQFFHTMDVIFFENQSHFSNSANKEEHYDPKLGLYSWFSFNLIFRKCSYTLILDNYTIYPSLRVYSWRARQPEGKET